MSLQRSEQNGRWGLLSQSVSQRQVGHLTRGGIRSPLAFQGRRSEKLSDFEFFFYEALVKRVADETLQVGSVLFHAMGPGVVAESFSFFFKKMPAPNKARPVGVVVVRYASLLGFVERRHYILRQPGIFCQDFVFEGDHMHDGDNSRSSENI